MSTAEGVKAIEKVEPKSSNVEKPIDKVADPIHSKQEEKKKKMLHEGLVKFEIIGDTSHLFSDEDFLKTDAKFEGEDVLKMFL